MVNLPEIRVPMTLSSVFSPGVNTSEPESVSKLERGWETSVPVAYWRNAVSVRSIAVLIDNNSLALSSLMIVGAMDRSNDFDQQSKSYLSAFSIRGTRR